MVSIRLGFDGVKDGRFREVVVDREVGWFKIFISVLGLVWYGVYGVGARWGFRGMFKVIFV